MPYVPVRVTRGALVAHRYIYAPPRCRTTQRGSAVADRVLFTISRVLALLTYYNNNDSNPPLKISLLYIGSSSHTLCEAIFFLNSLVPILHP